MTHPTTQTYDSLITHRPVWGIADDDGFVYTGDSSDPVYKHDRRDSAQADGPAWNRFGMGWVTVTGAMVATGVVSWAVTTSVIS